MSRQKEIVIRSRTTLIGLSEAAARLGCTRPHLSMVVRGIRKSRRTVEAMKRKNIRVEVAL